MSVFERFWSKVDASGDCWEWTAAKNSTGHGNFLPDGRRSGSRTYITAHRFAYESLVGPIPEGMHLDHLCRNTSCVNPDHVEVVTPAENVLRGFSLPAKNARKTECQYGHSLSGPNLARGSAGERICRTCRNCAKRERYAHRNLRAA